MPVVRGQLLATLADLAAHGLAAQAIAALPESVRLDHLYRASGTASAHLANRFVLPLASWGTELTGHVCSIASWTLLCHRGFDPDAPGDKAVRMAHDDAITWLKAFGNGRGVVLGYVDSSAPPDTMSSRSHLISRPRRGL